MPRRAPKKPDPLIDLSGHLRISSRLARPLVLRTLFERQAPVELEVGCGKGLFLSNMAGRAPDIDFLGVEISAAYARLVASKLARANLSNARIIQGDGLDVLRSCLLNQSLNAVHVYFPDPWWKARHRKRRVLTPIFLAHCARVLVAGGLLHIWTDVEEYVRESLDFVEQTGLFEPPVEDQELLALISRGERVRRESPYGGRCLPETPSRPKLYESMCATSLPCQHRTIDRPYVNTNHRFWT